MKREFRIGPGAASLILIIVLLSLSVLSVLALTNARRDERLSVRSASVITAIAELNAQAERDIAQLDAVLVKARSSAEDDTAYLKNICENMISGMNLSENTVSWSISDSEDRKLYCCVEILPISDSKRFEWKEHRLSSEFAEMELEDIWN